MNKMQKIVSILLAVVLCLMFALSVADTNEHRYETNFDQQQMLVHIANFTANGPRSIANPEANQAAMQYIIDTVESYGVINADSTAKPAYLVQDFVAEDDRYQNWYLQNVIVHIPANSAEPTGDAVMFMGHFDSVPMGNGASDDAVACSTMLEAIRYYLDRMEQGYELTNDLVFCFVNGEEYGLYGSEAFMAEFEGFDDIVRRIRFGTNLESRGTSGTLIMFETAANNYNTVKLFAEVNQSVFTCSLATMIYDMMPNGTDFSSFKDYYQGVNMANLCGGENYHTQNDNLENVGDAYLSQQAQIVDRLIDKLSCYDLDSLYEAEESALFFAYLNVTTVVYNHGTAALLAVLGLLLLLANLVLGRKEKRLGRTVKAIGVIVAGVLATMLVTQICYYLFQYIAVWTGNIDPNMVGSITYSNAAIVVGMGLLALAVTTLICIVAVKRVNIGCSDLRRAFAYIHLFLGIVLSFALADVSYLFIFSGLLLVGNEILISVRPELQKYHLEVLVEALYFPLLIPLEVLATSALGLTMAYVFGAVYALGIFGVSIWLAPMCGNLSVRKLFRKKTTPVEGALHILAVALAVFLAVSLSTPNASVNLMGKQNIVTLPYDDALVYVLDAEGNSEYRIYDLNAVGALEAYAPEMAYNGSYYAGRGEEAEVSAAIESSWANGELTVTRCHEDALVYLTFTNVDAESFTIDDGVTSRTYVLTEGKNVKIHSDCTVTVNGGSARVEYREVLRDYEPLIPGAYRNDPEQLHFNLWLMDEFILG